MKRSRALLCCAVLCTLLLACKKEGPPSALRALLPKDVAAGLSDQALAFVEALPADAHTFGYVDLGAPLDTLAARLPAEHHAIYKDFVEMLQRRGGVAVGKLSGAGLAMVEKHVVVLVPIAMPKDPSAILPSEAKLAAIGAFTAVGDAKAVEAFEAARAKGKLLYKEHGAWARGVLTRGSGKSAFFSIDVARVNQQARAPQPGVEHVERVTTTLGATGATLAVECKPGKVGEVRKLIESGGSMAKAQLARSIADLPDAGPGPMVRALAQAYGDALFSSVQLADSGNETTVTLGWHAPTLPARAASKPAPRVVAQGEWAVAEFSFGMPVFDALVAVTDVLQKPLDRPSVVRLLVDAAGAMANVGGLNPSGFSVSAGQTAVVASVHSATSALPSDPFPIAGGELVGVAQPWGLAVTRPAELAALVEAAGAAQPPMSLASSSKLGKAPDTFARVFVDATKLPPNLAQGFPLPLHSLEVAMTWSNLTAEIVAAPGKSAALTAPLESFVSGFTKEAERAYARRQNAPIPDEIMAIVQHHQAKSAAALLTPKVDGDRLRFSRDFPQVEARFMIGAAIVGIAAAVAIPAFMSYTKRGRDLDHQLPARIDPSAPSDEPAASDDAPVIVVPAK